MYLVLLSSRCPPFCLCLDLTVGEKSPRLLETEAAVLDLGT